MNENSLSFFHLEVTMNRLREFRAIRRVTQFQLRLITGINQAKISFIENGLIEPRDDEKKKLSKALGVKPEEIFPSAQGKAESRS